MLSEVQQTRQNIELECIALKNWEGYASVASHVAIQKSLARIEVEEKRLAGIIGEKEATNEMCAIYHKVIG